MERLKLQPWFAEIEQPMTDMSSSGGAQEGVEPVTKTVFIIFFKSKSIEAKVRKICDDIEAKAGSEPGQADGAAGASAGPGDSSGSGCRTGAARESERGVRVLR